MVSRYAPSPPLLRRHQRLPPPRLHLNLSGSTLPSGTTSISLAAFLLQHLRQHHHLSDRRRSTSRHSNLLSPAHRLPVKLAHRRPSPPLLPRLRPTTHLHPLLYGLNLPASSPPPSSDSRWQASCRTLARPRLRRPSFNRSRRDTRPPRLCSPHCRRDHHTSRRYDLSKRVSLLHLPTRHSPMPRLPLRHHHSLLYHLNSNSSNIKTPSSTRNPSSSNPLNTSPSPRRSSPLPRPPLSSPSNSNSNRPPRTPSIRACSRPLHS